jgi:photosystem II stability/assembly factor-like uncharacterized protein
LFYSKSNDMSYLQKFTVAIIFIALSLQVNFSSAQSGEWEVIQQSPSVMFNDLHFLPDGLHGWAVGYTTEGGNMLSSILKTTDGGQNWNKVSFPAGNSFGLNTVFFVNPDTGWVAGSSGIIYKTLNGGINWTSQSSGTGRAIAKMYFISALEGWATGGWGDGNTYLVIHTSDGGATWQSQSFGNTSYSSEDIFFYNKNTGWISGRDNTLAPHIHKTIDGGQTWVRQTVPITASNTPVVSIEFATINKGWAATSSIYATPAGAVLYTEDGGANWSIQTYTNQSYNYLSVQDSLRIAVVGVSVLTPADEKVIVTGDGGQNWAIHSPPTKAYTNGIQYVGDEIWLASTNSVILNSPDNGNTWNWQHISAYLRSIPWRNADDGIAVSGSWAGTDNYTYHSTDGGMNWPSDLDIPGGAQAMFIDGMHGWTLWEGNSARIWRTTDGGENWDPHYIGGGGWTGGIFFASPDTGWAFGSNGKLRFTSNGGATWTAQNPGVTDYVQAVFFINSSKGWAAGGYGGGNGFIIYTDNAGATWSPQTMANNNHILDLFFLNEDEGWATEVGGGIQYTADGGHYWNSVSSVPHSFAEEIHMVDRMTGWLIANNGSELDGKGFIYRTDDGGHSWDLEYESPWPNSNLSEFGLQPGNYIWACGTHNTILKYSVAVGINDNKASAKEGIIANCYPSPFISELTVSYSFDSPGDAWLDIYDLSGKKIRSITAAAAVSKNGIFTWDGNDESGIAQPPGTYLLKITSGNKSTALKAVKSSD